MKGSWTFLCLLAIVASLILLLYFSKLGVITELNKKGFTMKILPEKLTLRVGEYRNLTLLINSTGYEGFVILTGPLYSFKGGDISGTLEYEIMPVIPESGLYISSNDKLERTLQIRWDGLLGQMQLRVEGYGNYNQENQFKVESNIVDVTITLPT